jgi:hypothetical protein
MIISPSSQKGILVRFGQSIPVSIAQLAFTDPTADPIEDSQGREKYEALNSVSE